MVLDKTLTNLWGKESPNSLQNGFVSTLSFDLPSGREVPPPPSTRSIHLGMTNHPSCSKIKIWESFSRKGRTSIGKHRDATALTPLLIGLRLRRDGPLHGAWRAVLRLMAGRSDCSNDF